MKKLALVIGALLFIAGCNLIYETGHTYIPPQTDYGRFCANQCLTGFNNCELRCEQDKANCETMEDVKRYTEYFIKHADKDNQYHDLPSSRRTCSDYFCKQRCNENRNICHTNCGGSITTHRVCTAFCQ